MYQVYIKPETGLDKVKIGEFKDIEKAHEKIEAELVKNKDLKYVIEEMSGGFDIWGEVITNVVEEN